MASWAAAGELKSGRVAIPGVRCAVPRVRCGTFHTVGTSVRSLSRLPLRSNPSKATQTAHETAQGELKRGRVATQTRKRIKIEHVIFTLPFEDRALIYEAVSSSEAARGSRETLVR
jgi:hypothetical protein